MLVGRWWVERVESDGWKASRKVQQDPRPQQQIGLHTLRRERSNDDHGAAEMGRERGEVVMTSERQCCVKNDAW